MAKIQFNDVKAGIGQGSTWGTASDLTSGGGLVHFESISIDKTNTNIPIRANGNSPYDIIRGDVSVSGSISSLFSFNSLILRAVACMAGGATVSSELTASQGDYGHTINHTSDALNKFLTISALKESDQVYEVPSLKPTTLTMEFAVNQVPSFSFDFVGDNRIDSAVSTPANTASEVSALSLPTVTGAIEAFSGTNMYVRLADYSASTALSSSNDQYVSSVRVTISRDADAVRTTRGANTPYVTLPYQQNMTVVQVELMYEATDDSEQDPGTDEANEATKMFELFYDGAAIGTGGPYSYKFRVPSMKLVQPAQYIAAAGQRVKDGAVVYQAIVPTAAAAGMTGVTDLYGHYVVNTRSTALLS